MADCLPVASSGPREPVKRPKPIPKVVREACLLMVYGDPDDEDGGPIDFITAAKSVGIRPDTLRRYLHRPQVIALLRSERRAFREAVCAGNESALQRVRDGDEHQNPMARVAAVRALEALGEAETGGFVGTGLRAGYVLDLREQQLPGMTVVINTGVPAGAPGGSIIDDDPRVIDVTPKR